MNSSMYEFSSDLSVPYSDLCLSLNFCHRDSMLLVWAPVSGLIKWRLWLTVSCWYPSGMSLMVLYAAHWSDTIVVPGTTYCLISGRRVAASRRSTGTTKHLLVLRSMPPKHHCFSVTLPLLYLVRSVSSISTTLPGPPIFKGCLRKCSVQTFLK